MSDDELSRLPEKYDRYADRPFGGLFGTNIQLKVLEELVADPYSNYRIADLARILGISTKSTKSALAALERLGFVSRENENSKHPIFRVNKDSRMLTALTFLSYALSDDRDSTQLMDEAVLEYYERNIRPGLKREASSVELELNLGGEKYTGVVMQSGASDEDDMVVPETV